MHRSQGKTTYLTGMKTVNIDQCYEFKKEKEEIF